MQTLIQQVFKAQLLMMFQFFPECELFYLITYFSMDCELFIRMLYCGWNYYKWLIFALLNNSCLPSVQIQIAIQRFREKLSDDTIVVDIVIDYQCREKSSKAQSKVVALRETWRNTKSFVFNDLNHHHLLFSFHFSTHVRLDCLSCTFELKLRLLDCIHHDMKTPSG
jgi:hypothetical protein